MKTKCTLLEPQTQIVWLIELKRWSSGCEYKQIFLKESDLDPENNNQNEIFLNPVVQHNVVNYITSTLNLLPA